MRPLNRRYCGLVNLVLTFVATSGLTGWAQAVADCRHDRHDHFAADLRVGFHDSIISSRKILTSAARRESPEELSFNCKNWSRRFSSRKRIFLKISTRILARTNSRLSRYALSRRASTSAPWWCWGRSSDLSRRLRFPWAGDVGSVVGDISQCVSRRGHVGRGFWNSW